MVKVIYSLVILLHIGFPISASSLRNRDTIDKNSEFDLSWRSRDTVFRDSGSRNQDIVISNSESNSIWMNPSPVVNWTTDYDRNLAEFALDFASAAYAPDPSPCLQKHGARLVKRVQISCDYVHDEVNLISKYSNHIRNFSAGLTWQFLRNGL